MTCLHHFMNLTASVMISHTLHLHYRWITPKREKKKMPTIQLMNNCFSKAMSAFKKQLVKDLSTMFCHYVEPTNSIQNVEDKLKC